jgi:hypothetical protein
LENLKIRASYGTLGNQLLDNNFYPYISSMEISTSPFLFTGGSPSPNASPPGLVSPSLTWETVKTKNFGVDISALQNRLEATFDLYTRDTEDMLMRVEYPGVLGAQVPEQNAADLRTKGWEMQFGWHERIGKDWKYQITFSLADWQTEITKYENPTGALSEYYVGQKIGEIWGYETVGIFQTEEEISVAADQSKIGKNWKPGDIQYADLDGNGKIGPGYETLANPGDRRIIGNESPRLSFGFNLNLSYKNLSLSTFFQGIGKRDYWPPRLNRWFFPFVTNHVEWHYITDTWNEENRDAYFPAAQLKGSGLKNLKTQSRFLQDASYVRLKNITLSYDLPKSLKRKIGLEEARIYVSGMNLWEYSKIRKPLDPEYLKSDVLGDYSHFGDIEYPLQRIYSVGAIISF